MTKEIGLALAIIGGVLMLILIVIGSLNAILSGLALALAMIGFLLVFLG